MPERKWKGINEIMHESIKHLEVHQEGNIYFFYSAPKGYYLEMSGVAIAPSTWRRRIKDFGILKGGRGDRIFVRGFDEGSGSMVSDDEEPLLELKDVE